MLIYIENFLVMMDELRLEVVPPDKVDDYNTVVSGFLDILDRTIADIIDATDLKTVRDIYQGMEEQRMTYDHALKDRKMTPNGSDYIKYVLDTYVPGLQMTVRQTCTETELH